MAILGKIEMGDRDRLLVHRLTEALNKLADELHTYNHPQDTVVLTGDDQVIRTYPTGEEL